MLPRHLDEHPIWRELRPYVVVSIYGIEVMKNGRRRARIELKHLPDGLRNRTLEIEVACPVCGKSTKPIRSNTSRSEYVYWAPSCPLEQTRKCSRHPKISREHLRLRAVLEGDPLPSNQMELL